MPYSEASKRATMKYQKTHLEQIAIRTKKGTRDRWKDAADRAGESLAQFIIAAVEARIAGENLSVETLPENLPPETPSNNPMQL